MIEEESVEVEAKSKVVRVDEEAATIKANEAQTLKNECESELAEAVPALEAAVAALDTLKVSALNLHLFLEHLKHCKLKSRKSEAVCLISARWCYNCEVNEKSSIGSKASDGSCVRDERLKTR